MERIDRDVWLTIPGECDILLTLSRVNLRPNNKVAFRYAFSSDRASVQILTHAYIVYGLL